MVLQYFLKLLRYLFEKSWFEVVWIYNLIIIQNERGPQLCLIETNSYVGCLLGHSVCCNVHGFEPYFYISCPSGMGPDDVSRFHQVLEVFGLLLEETDHVLFVNFLHLLVCVFGMLQGRMKESNRNSKVPKFVRRIEMVQRRSIMYYQQQNSHPFLKIVVALPTMVASCRGKVRYYQ